MTQLQAQHDERNAYCPLPMRVGAMAAVLGD
jgi:hypothetical protein